MSLSSIGNFKLLPASMSGTRLRFLSDVRDNGTQCYATKRLGGFADGFGQETGPVILTSSAEMNERNPVGKHGRSQILQETADRHVSRETACQIFDGSHEVTMLPRHVQICTNTIA